MVKGSLEWEYDKDKGLVIHLSPVPPGLSAGEVCRHARSVKKEMLLTLRSLIDLAVKQTEQAENQTEKGGTKIKVE
jgi:hypothetical protein